MKLSQHSVRTLTHSCENGSQKPVETQKQVVWPKVAMLQKLWWELEYVEGIKEKVKLCSKFHNLKYNCQVLETPGSQASQASQAPEAIALQLRSMLWRSAPVPGSWNETEPCQPSHAIDCELSEWAESC